MNEAVAWGDYERVTSLLEEGAPTDNTDCHNRTPIDWIVAGSKDPGELVYTLLHKTSSENVVAAANKLFEFYQTWDEYYNPEEHNFSVYMLCKYTARPPTDGKFPRLIFALLCMCRSGVNVCKLIEDIVELVVESVRSVGEDEEELDQDVISPVGAIRIFHILTHIRPLYFHNETMIPQILHDTSMEPDMEGLANEMMCIVNQVPRLTVICIAHVRHLLSDPQMSILKTVTALKNTIPPKVTALLTLDNLFSGEATLDKYEQTYDYVCGNDSADEISENTIHFEDNVFYRSWPLRWHRLQQFTNGAYKEYV